ncbi:1-deoxy-D-xylulose-5-phosphate reductoisomerase [Candidatus Pelagibacter sp. HIMB1521]|uniref:1-deoxy-D-xylulose-5-phosphate reductoisomerase n=1 Tax=Candidatus Pelagibacter sp. HIMB1521 TaxID=3413344 RepID=UPI003F87A5A4
MKIKIAILGSTGSVGKSLFDIVSRDKKNYEIHLLTAHNNYKELLKQTKIFKVNNVIISNFKSYENFKKLNKNKRIKIYYDFDNFNKIFKKKIDYAMSAIVGLNGLEPTFKIIKHTRKIAIANKESIICGWNLIKNQLVKYNTKFIPVDSEHFSVSFSIKDKKNIIDKVILTASGGPFLNLPLKKFKNINVKDALKHPNWKMGKKITIDSATLMNKVFEVIEAKKIFEIKFSQLSITIHPRSYIHSIIKFNNGLIEMIAHEADMRIPIYNSIYDSKKKLNFKNKKIRFSELNNLQLKSVNKSQFPSIKILDLLPKHDSLFETVLITANDELVKQFLDKKIKFNDIFKKLYTFLNKAEFKKYKHVRPKNIKQILNLSNNVRLYLCSNKIKDI